MNLIVLIISSILLAMLINTFRLIKRKNEMEEYLMSMYKDTQNDNIKLKMENFRLVTKLEDTLKLNSDLVEREEKFLFEKDRCYLLD